MNKIYIAIVPVVVVVRRHAGVALEGKAIFAFRNNYDLEVFKRSMKMREAMVLEWVKNHMNEEFEELILNAPEYYETETK